MKKKTTIWELLAILMAVGLCLGLTGLAMAADNADQTVTMSITAIDEVTVESGPTLTFNAANIDASGGGAYVVGSDAFQITDATTHYSVTTNSATDKKITAALDANLSATGLQLFASLASASGVSGGEKDLSSSFTTAQDIVTGLSQEADADQVITYRAVATVATPVASYTPVVTYTITAG